MPLKLISHLDAAVLGVGDYKRELADAPVLLDRAETAIRVFREIRAKLVELAPTLHELKGVAAGLRQADPIARQHSEIVKQKVKDEQLDPALGKELIAIVSAAALSLREAAEVRTGELNRLAGKVDGLYLAAITAFSELTSVLDAARRAKEVEKEEAEDWSGRGTENGQRPAEAAGNGNGRGKVVPLKKAPQKGAGRVKRVKREETEAAPGTAPEVPPA